MESDFDIDKILSEIDDDEEREVMDRESDDQKTDLQSDDDFDRESGADEEEGADLHEDDKALPASAEGESSLIGAHTEESRGEAGLQDEADPEEKSSAEKTEASERKRDYGFTVKGTKSWNTRKPYHLNISDEKLKQQEEYFSGAFFFIKEEIDEETIKNEIKRSFAGFMRNPSRNVSEEYKEFIFKLIISEIKSITSFFNIPPDKKDLFIYHIGPTAMYEIVTGKIKKKMGLAYRYDNANRRAISFFPDEFIKLKILDWYEENINIKDLQFDSAQILDELTMIVSRSYLTEKRKFSKKLDKINYRLGAGKRISSQELLRLKGDEWFGSGSIAVYKRFLQNTLFK
jgi:hypothetical protein